MLEVKEVSFSLNGKKILQDIDFTLSSGDFLGIVGPNGAGKTTLLRLISGVVYPERGKILIEGKNIESLSYRRLALKIAMVPQNTFINFPFTVFDVVLMGRTPYLGRFERETERDLSKVKECMDLTGVWHLRERRVTEISGGELQRVIIAQALAQDTPVLLLDEPTSHLDINHELEIISIISRLNEEEGKAVILVSHDLNLAARYCRKLILLKEGRIFAKGEVEKVLTPENIRSVYHLNALVRKHPVTGFIYTVPVSVQTEEESRKKRGKVHLIGGGGSASKIMKALIDRGYEVSIGVVNIFDADFETAQFFKVPCVVEAPFSPITSESYRKNMDLIGKSQIVVLCNVPFGSGNLLNLKVALWAVRERGIKVVVHDGTPIDKRDYTGGEARRMFSSLLREGAVVVEKEDELLFMIKEYFS